ncbi:MAG: hypothetical protein M9953_10335 [Thermomicrobiales bacterium]|nr:hypothetical protein [Thermomicrobiales bacterium]MCO5225728.1 hypothetical protein [Thermomicrobiales bacterium]MCO5228035.1 hypothetical protein [Thermomicrobiales bacterium]
MIRVIELPACRMATSGPSPDDDPFIEGGVLHRFDAWFSVRDRGLDLAPRDLMWVDPTTERLVWNYLMEHDETCEPWQEVHFPGGLYAADVSRDQDDRHGEEVLQQLRDWVEASPFVADEGIERSVAFHITTSPSAADALGYHQLEILLPIRIG